MMIYNDESQDTEAIRVAKELRSVLLEGSGSNELHAYLNYAHGDETPEELYGHQPWRLNQLRELKKKYDPHGRFNFYGPVA
jgi:FAD/FMN-containing dehydrogenase